MPMVLTNQLYLSHRLSCELQHDQNNRRPLANEIKLVVGATSSDDFCCIVIYTKTGCKNVENVKKHLCTCGLGSRGTLAAVKTFFVYIISFSVLHLLHIY